MPGDPASGHLFLPAPRAGLQSRQFHADAGDAEDGGAVVADQLAREADQDRRQGREPRPLHNLSDGRGRGAATDVPGNPVADRPATGATRSGMTAAVSDETDDEGRGVPG